MIYTENCVVCHGADGQGIGTYPGLNHGGVRVTDYETLFKTIERGRYGTAMAAWGGRLSEAELASLVSFLRAWEPAARRWSERPALAAE